MLSTNKGCCIPHLRPAKSRKCLDACPCAHALCQFGDGSGNIRARNLMRHVAKAGQSAGARGARGVRPGKDNDQRTENPFGCTFLSICHQTPWLGMVFHFSTKESHGIAKGLAIGCGPGPGIIFNVSAECLNVHERILHCSCSFAHLQHLWTLHKQLQTFVNEEVASSPLGRHASILQF